MGNWQWAALLLPGCGLAFGQHHLYLVGAGEYGPETGRIRREQKVMGILVGGKEGLLLVVKEER